MGTIAFPADPITNGAVAIQSTTFVNVAADWTWVDFDSAIGYLKDKEGIRHAPSKKIPGWTFYERTDLVGSNADLRSVVGIKVQHLNRLQQLLNVAYGMLGIPLKTSEIIVYQWFPAQNTLSNSSIMTHYLTNWVGMTLPKDPETNAVFVDVGLARHIDETLGFLILRVAANVPTLVPASKALAGSHPLV